MDLPKLDGPTHRYIGASPACWAMYSNLLNAGEQPILPTPARGMIVDAYAAQQAGVPSDQAVQSVAVHLLVLHGVFVREAEPARALWIRRRALRETGASRRGRFRWLAPPSFEGCLNVSHIVRTPDPEARADRAQDYVEQVWSFWAVDHARTISDLYDAFVVPDIL